jgi:hypothetical protein
MMAILSVSSEYIVVVREINSYNNKVYMPCLLEANCNDPWND